MASERDSGVESDDENPTIFVEFLPKAPATLELVSRKGSDEMMFHIGSKPSDSHVEVRLLARLVEEGRERKKE
ncbi:hypothetical protein PIIN_09755 [Serendipita indica DSM 11827]|uniref:Uncharacterized protein n=1 Tax=Serendipita indica (strain DSM 11827) TaxID=1109443 RepID=G4TWS2_SERID|nr:hypothetical protein PIIN_09755 [Serendipita indica DSM 11827]